MQSILELEIQHRNLRANKRKTAKALTQQPIDKGNHSRSRNKMRKLQSKPKSQTKSQKCSEGNQDVATCEINQPLEPHLQCLTLPISFIEKKGKSNEFFQLECAKLVQANTVLSEIIKQTAKQKYLLEEKILQTTRKIDKLTCKSPIDSAKSSQTGK